MLYDSSAAQFTANVSTLEQAYTETTLKLKIILKKWNVPSISDEGSYGVPSLKPNTHISEVVLSPTLDMEEYSDPRIELDSHTNMVILGSNSFVFESTGRTCNVQPLVSDPDIEKNVPLIDGALACKFPYSG